jgi:hypothetical protein
MKIRFESIDEDARKTYERFFFERICSMNVSERQDFTVPLPQVDGLNFTSVQDTVERLTTLSGRLSTFQWRNCIFAPIRKSVRPNDIYEEIFSNLKTKVPSLFVRSYVYLIFIKVEPDDSPTLDFGNDIQASTKSPSFDDFQIYYWNTKYEVRLGRKKNLFGDSGTNKTQSDAKPDTVLVEDDAEELEASPEKLFIVENPEHELQRIQDANSDIIDAFKAFNNTLPLVEQTKHYLDKITHELDSNSSARILAEGPARSGKTVLAMSFLAKYPKSKMLLMNWYFYDALIDAFKIWGELSKDEIEELFSMPGVTKEIVDSSRGKLNEFRIYQSNPTLLDVSLRAMEAFRHNPNNMPGWAPYTKEHPTPRGEKIDEWRVKRITRSNVGDLVPVIVVNKKDDPYVMEFVEVMKRHDNGSTSVKRVNGAPKFTIDKQDLSQECKSHKKRLLEYKSCIENGQGRHYIAELLKEIADALHDSAQKFFHHNLDQPEGCWVVRGNPTTCNITEQDLIICDEVQRLGLIPKFQNRDEFDEVEAILENSKRSFLCGDDFQMLNPIYDQGIGAIEQMAGEDITTLKIPDSIGVPAEVGELIKYLLDEHCIPERRTGFEIQLLYRDDIRFVELFEADGSTKKHYSIPINYGWYQSDPYILRTNSKTDKCTDECTPCCEHKRISMLTEQLRERFKFFCSEAVMPNFALSAYELISREVESVYLKIPEEIGLDVVKRPMSLEAGTKQKDRNWKKQHLYVLMTRATMKLVINVEDKALYEHLSERMRLFNGACHHVNHEALR